MFMSPFNDRMIIKTGNVLWCGYDREIKMPFWRKLHRQKSWQPVPCPHPITHSPGLLWFVAWSRNLTNKCGPSTFAYTTNASIRIPSVTAADCPSHTIPVTNTAITEFAGYPLLRWLPMGPCILVQAEPSTPQMTNPVWDPDLQEKQGIAKAMAHHTGGVTAFWLNTEGMDRGFWVLGSFVISWIPKDSYFQECERGAALVSAKWLPS